MTGSGTRMRHLYDPSSTEPYPLSRSKLELFLECPCCFVLDRKRGVGRPDGPPFTLNLTIDALLKREFDQHRAKAEPHPLMRTYGVDAIPFQHPELRTWRDTPTGIRALHAPSNFLVYGIVDDVWVESDGSLVIVDYKATSMTSGAHVADMPRLAYERQLELYQWLFRRNGFSVSPRSYLVYVNADRDREAFDGRLECSVHLVPHLGDDTWVEDALMEAHRVLQQEPLPVSATRCEWCMYRKAAISVELV